MSHEIEHRTYNVKLDTKKIEAELNDYVSHRTWQEGGGGLGNRIRWIDKVFDTYNDAQDYIESIDKGWYEQIAVKYKEYERPTEKQLAKYNELIKKSQEAYKKVDELERTNHFKDVKAQYISCPHCGSKINREIYTSNKCMVKVNYCPVCRESMLKETALKQLESAREKYRKLKEQCQAEYRKQELKSKSKEMWLVKIEYHM